MMYEQTRTIWWQAHRGGGAHEAPDNTMAANRYTWALGGIPEADLRTTKDGVIICLHDDTLARTTTAPSSIKDTSASDLTFDEIRPWDAGLKFDDRFRGETVPSLQDVFAEMSGRPERMMYLDLKQVDLVQLGKLIDQYGVNRQVIFTHHLQDNCRRMKQIASDVRSMLWIGGKAEQIKEKFELARRSSFDGLDQVQLHLNLLNDPQGDWRYTLEPEFLEYALQVTSSCGIELEVLPFSFDERSIHLLLQLGIQWFATDEPSLFVTYVRSWQKST
ncbi:glycerophosphodiester phosphodiesterase [Marinicrinis lubricantis]|uniref:Glycerophosphodiester phosphodiesterase n=1 Tax=Marinicrinis lubricantis TaxID=2086470 RepID=A0ABW1IVZ0_9BACL